MMNYTILKTTAALALMTSFLSAQEVKVEGNDKVKVHRIELNADDLKIGENTDLLKLVQDSDLSEEEKKQMSAALKVFNMDVLPGDGGNIESKVKVLAGGKGVKIQRIVIDAEELAGKGLVDLTQKIDLSKLSEEERADMKKGISQIKAMVMQFDKSLTPQQAEGKKLAMSQEEFIQMAEKVNGKPLSDSQRKDLSALWEKNKK